MSTLVGDIVLKTQEKHPELAAPVIASALALMCGCFVFTMGILRLGFVVDFIPLVTIASFMTGSAINIAAGQFPTVFGINKLFNTRAPTYWVIIHTFQYLGHTTLDAAIGLTALTMLCKFAPLYGTTSGLTPRCQTSSAMFATRSQSATPSESDSTFS
jgi:sodium-independent sulfate anion transporter 11